MKSYPLMSAVAAFAACASTPKTAPSSAAYKSTKSTFSAAGQLHEVRQPDPELEKRLLQAEKARKLAEYIRAGQPVSGQRFREEKKYFYHTGIMGKEIAGGERFFYDIYLHKPVPPAFQLYPNTGKDSPFSPAREASIALWLLPYQAQVADFAALARSELTIMTGTDGAMSTYSTDGMDPNQHCRAMGLHTRKLLELSGHPPPTGTESAPGEDNSQSIAACHLFHQRWYERALDELLQLYQDQEAPKNLPHSKRRGITINEKKISYSTTIK